MKKVLVFVVVGLMFFSCINMNVAASIPPSQQPKKEKPVVVAQIDLGKILGEIFSSMVEFKKAMDQLDHFLQPE